MYNKKANKKSNGRKVQDERSKVSKRARGYDKKVKDTSEECVKKNDHSYENDFAWYNHNPVLLESAARFPFAVPVGGKINLPTDYRVAGDGSETTFKRSMRTAGITTIAFRPAIGYSDSDDSPATIAAREIYAKVRKAYSGTLTADAPDFMMYLLSLDGIYSYIAALKRIYRAVNVYSGFNKMVPKAIIAACLGITETSGGANYLNNIMSQLRAGKTRLWGGINTLISNANKFTCPAVMDIFNRHYWMNDNIFLDRPSPKGQMYMFYQSDYWKFNLDAESRGMCEQKKFNLVIGQNDNVVDVLLDFGNQLLEALNNDEDAYTINGYLSRAFEGTSNFSIDLLAENETTEFVYSDEVLGQIHNLNIIATDTMDITVKQDGLTNKVISTPKANYSAGHSGVFGYSLPNMILDSDNLVPTSQEVVINTRLKSVLKRDKTYTNTNRVYDVYCGTEIVFQYAVYYLNDKDEVVTTVYSPANFTDMQKQLFFIQYASMFHKAPYFVFMLRMSTGDVTDYYTSVGDFTNVTNIDEDNLIDLHRMCIYSEFNSFSL